MTAIRVFGKSNARVGSNVKYKFDYWLALTVGALLVIGLMMVYSTSFDAGLLYHDDSAYFFRSQIYGLGLGLLFLTVLMQFDYNSFGKFSTYAMIGILILLLLTHYFGFEINGSKRWIKILGVSMQPSEFAKPITLIYIAYWLSSKGDRIQDWAYGLVPFSLIIGAVSALIIWQPDASTTFLIIFISFIVYFIAGANLIQMILAGITVTGVFTFLVLTIGYGRGRIDAFVTGLRDPFEAGWHVQQSLIALANGGLTGVGLGNSTQKFGQLPLPHSDSIFAIIGEELGLIGSLIVILLFAVLVWRGLRIAVNAREQFGALLALGITVWLAIQSLMNIAVITAVVPFTGMPLPFLSHGGTSLAAALVGIGFLLNISRDAAMGGQTRKKQVRKRQEQSGRSKSRKRMEAVSESDDMRRRYGRSYLPRVSRD